MNLSTLYILGIAITGICFMVDVIFVIMSIIQLYCSVMTVFISSHFKILTAVTMILFTMCTLGDIIHLVMHYNYSH